MSKPSIHLRSPKKKDVISGLESVIHNLQKNAKEMEVDRYGVKAQAIMSPMSPTKIVQLIKREHEGLDHRPDRMILDPKSN